MGMQLNLHYCGGELDNVSMDFVEKNVENHSDDCCYDIEYDDSCCVDEILKQSTDDTIVYQLNIQIPYFIEQSFSDWKPALFMESQLQIPNTYFAYSIWSNAPPLYKLYHQYLLYA